MKKRRPRPHPPPLPLPNPAPPPILLPPPAPLPTTTRRTVMKKRKTSQASLLPLCRLLLKHLPHPRPASAPANHLPLAPPNPKFRLRPSQLLLLSNLRPSLPLSKSPLPPPPPLSRRHLRSPPLHLPPRSWSLPKSLLHPKRSRPPLPMPLLSPAPRRLVSLSLPPTPPSDDDDLVPSGLRVILDGLPYRTLFDVPRHLFHLHINYSFACFT